MAKEKTKKPRSKSSIGKELSITTGFFMVILALLYAVWNIWGVSIFHMWLAKDSAMASLNPAMKTMVSLPIIIALLWSVRQAYQGIGIVGTLILSLLIGVCIWCIVSVGWLHGDNAKTALWWGQVPLAFVIAFGMRYAKWDRMITGRVPVDDGEV